MLKKEIDYKDFDGKTKKGVYHFHLTSMELVEINLMEDLKAVTESNDPRRIIPTMKRLIRAAVGVQVGDLYVKNEDQAAAFMSSEAYSVLMVELCTGEDAESKTAAFIRAVAPTLFDEAEKIKNQDALPSAPTESVASQELHSI